MATVQGKWSLNLTGKICPISIHLWGERRNIYVSTSFLFGQGWSHVVLNTLCFLIMNIWVSWGRGKGLWVIRACKNLLAAVTGMRDWNSVTGMRESWEGFQWYSRNVRYSWVIKNAFIMINLYLDWPCGLVLKGARSYTVTSIVRVLDLVTWETCQSCLHASPKSWNDGKMEEKGLQHDHTPTGALSLYFFLSLCVFAYLASMHLAQKERFTLNKEIKSRIYWAK